MRHFLAQTVYCKISPGHLIENLIDASQSLIFPSESEIRFVPTRCVECTDFFDRDDELLTSGGLIVTVETNPFGDQLTILVKLS